MLRSSLRQAHTSWSKECSITNELNMHYPNLLKHPFQLLSGRYELSRESEDCMKQDSSAPNLPF